MSKLVRIGSALLVPYVSTLTEDDDRLNVIRRVVSAVSSLLGSVRKGDDIFACLKLDLANDKHLVGVPETATAYGHSTCAGDLTAVNLGYDLICKEVILYGIDRGYSAKLNCACLGGNDSEGDESFLTPARADAVELCVDILVTFNSVVEYREDGSRSTTLTATLNLTACVEAGEVCASATLRANAYTSVLGSICLSEGNLGIAYKLKLGECEGNAILLGKKSDSILTLKNVDTTKVDFNKACFNGIGGCGNYGCSLDSHTVYKNVNRIGKYQLGLTLAYCESKSHSICLGGSERIYNRALVSKAEV